MITPDPAAARPALASAILITWRRNRDYCLRMLGDLRHDQVTAQPVPGVTMNHPAWVLSHLNVYTPIAGALAAGKPFDDPIDHRYGQKSVVLDDPAEYPARDPLIAEYTRLHDDAGTSLELATDATLAAQNPVDRWRALHPTVGDMLATLMIKHESAHLGQLSAWRRAMRLPRVPM